MNVGNHWKRFRPHVIQRTITPALRLRTSLWRQARERVDEMFPGRQLRDDALTRAIQSTRDQALSTNDPVLWYAALILQAPRAARAQEQMDQHTHGYHNREARLFELIDFNDTLVSAVLATPEGELSTFADEAKRAMDAFCKQVRTRCFSNEQYEAIVHGLSREIAVFRGAKAEGLEPHMTSRVEDALGIDMVITDPSNGRSVNIDVKTRSAYYYRLRDLVREGRITTEMAGTAEDQGYCPITNEDKLRTAHIVLLRVDEETYGAVQNFSFVSTTPLGEAIRELFDHNNPDLSATIADSINLDHSMNVT